MPLMLPAEPTGGSPSRTGGVLQALADSTDKAAPRSGKNEFVLTKDEELARVVARAARKTASKSYAATRFDPHNVGVRAGAGDADAAQASLGQKVFA